MLGGELKVFGNFFLVETVERKFIRVVNPSIE